MAKAPENLKKYSYANPGLQLKTVCALDGGCGLWRVRNRKWTHPANRPLALEPSPKEAQTV